MLTAVQSGALVASEDGEGGLGQRHPVPDHVCLHCT